MVQANEEVQQAPIPEVGESGPTQPSPSSDSPSTPLEDIRQGLASQAPPSDGTSEKEAAADKPESAEKPAQESRTYTQEEFENARRTLQSQYDRNLAAEQQRLAAQSYQEREREEIRAELMRIQEEDPDYWRDITRDPQVLQFMGDIAKAETQSLRGQLEQQVGSRYYADGLTEGTVNVVKAANTQPEFKDWNRKTFEEKGLWPQNESGQIEDYQKWLGTIIDYAANERAQKLAKSIAEEQAKSMNRQYIAGVNGNLGTSIPPTGSGGVSMGPDTGVSGADLIRAGLEANAGRK